MQKKINAVIIFCRYPAVGKVKTRLAAKTGQRFAVSLYKLCAEHAFSECAKLYPDDAGIFIFHPESDDTGAIKSWAGYDFNYFTQQGEDLGDKMSNAMDKLFNIGYQKVVLIGTDIPGITGEIISGAFKKLDFYDCILGPADDGGFYLIGTKNFYPGLFDNILWSRETVLDMMKKKLGERGLKTEFTAKLTDIDTLQDLRHLLKTSEKQNSLVLEILKLMHAENIKPE